MVIKPHKVFTATLLGICSLQLLLPFFMSLSVLFIKLWQRSIIDENPHNTAFFEQLKVNENDLQPSADKEMLYKGKLYDIQSIKKENGAYVVLAIPDEKETRLTKLNAGLVEKDQKAAPDHFKVFPFSFLFFEATPRWQLFRSHGEKANCRYVVFQPMRQSAILTPPPRC
jgi:hypothetical protein